MRFMLNWLFTSIAIAIATFLVPGIQPFGFAEAWVCFAFVGLFLNIVDSLVKPFLTVISLPLTIITLGIFQLVVNSFMLELASYLSVNLLARVSPLPALDRPLWAASWYPLCAAFSTASPGTNATGYGPPQHAKTKAVHRNDGRPCHLPSLRGQENRPFLPRPQMAGAAR